MNRLLLGCLILAGCGSPRQIDVTMPQGVSPVMTDAFCLVNRGSSDIKIGNGRADGVLGPDGRWKFVLTYSDTWNPNLTDVDCLVIGG